jgi:hypothetical protein
MSRATARLPLPFSGALDEFAADEDRSGAD